MLVPIISSSFVQMAAIPAMGLMPSQQSLLPLLPPRRCTAGIRGCAALGRWGGRRRQALLLRRLRLLFLPQRRLLALLLLLVGHHGPGGRQHVHELRPAVELPALLLCRWLQAGGRAGKKVSPMWDGAKKNMALAQKQTIHTSKQVQTNC